MTYNITNDNFEQEVLKSDIPVIVDFWATWCGPCNMMHPIIDDIANEYDGKIKVCKVDTDKESMLCAKFAVMSIPMFMAFENGKEIAKTVGYMSKDELLEKLDLL